MERFFGLAKPGNETQPAGWAGQITSNSFMKREFGSKIIEEFLVHKDLRLVADIAGAYIPGHGTPTVILVGRNQRPVGTTVRAVLGVRGEPGRPEEPAKGIVWRAIVEHLEEPGWNDGWVTIADLDRGLLARHPWSLSGGGAVQIKERIESAGIATLGARVTEIGFGVVTREDSAYMVGEGTLSRHRVAEAHRLPIVEGDVTRDWAITHPVMSIWPYSPATLKSESDPGTDRLLWPFRAGLSDRVAYGNTQLERGLAWFEYSMFFAKRFRTPLSIAFAFVTTHNHFVLDRGGKVFKQSAPVIKLPAGATEEEHQALLGVLNSSTACFWLKQNSHNKGEGGGARVDAGYAARGEPFRETYEFTGTTLQDYPLPSVLPQQGRLLDLLAQQLAALTPSAVAAGLVPTAERLAEARAASGQVLARMVMLQEELDWEVYRLYGLIDDDLTYSRDDLPGLVLGERAFEIALARKLKAGEEATTWFSHPQQRSTPILEIPTHWPVAFRELVQRRLDLIVSDPSIRLLEKPEHKRRWACESWEKQQATALCDWLLDRLEDKGFWFDAQGRPQPRSIAQLADEVAREADLLSVLALWEGRPDVPVSDSLARLLGTESAPYLAAYRLKDSGLRKHDAWEATWALQRREDAGEKVGPIPVPPKYTNADFRRTSWWQARGKLDVPKERFILYPDAGRETDPTTLLGWAGRDHAQQSLALSLVIGARESDGWDDDRLVPLVAGLAELQPWVEQWHADVDPTYGVSLAAFCREQLTARASQVGKSLEELAAWRPPASTRGRRIKTVVTS